jgi:hypothetical protein
VYFCDLIFFVQTNDLYKLRNVKYFYDDLSLRVKVGSMIMPLGAGCETFYNVETKIVSDESFFFLFGLAKYFVSLAGTKIFYKEKISRLGYIFT